jgi:sugar O-acyltransferase (sialic acid O-acetyltransferase NeuD family)
LSGLLIIGSGGHGKVVADAALRAGWMEIAFLDDRGVSAPAPLGLKVVGTVAELARAAARFSAVVVAVGDCRRRLELLQSCQAQGLKLVSIVHPSSAVSPFATLAPGCVILAQSAVNADAVLGMGCIVNTGATVDHDCRLGRAVHVCPGAHLAGNVRIGDRAWIGIGAVVRQAVAIGCDAVVGAGAAVLADVPDGATVIGVPAKQHEIDK